MIVVYKTRYIPPTDTTGARFRVTCLNTMKAHTVPFNYTTNNPLKQAIHDAFGEDTANIEFVNDIAKFERMYAVNI
jgi:hypothetical protein